MDLAVLSFIFYHKEFSVIAEDNAICYSIVYIFTKKFISKEVEV